MSTETTQTLSLDAALSISQRNGEPQWMQDLRQRAWEMYESTAMPSLKDEEWRRTEPQLRKINFDMLQVPQPNGSVPLPAEWQPAADALLTRSGLLISHVSTPAHRSVAQELAAQGVILTDMNTAVREHGDLVRTAFMTEAVKPDFSKFAALNGALWSGGTFLYVPDNVKVELPLQSSTWLDQPGLGVFPHTLVVVGRNSEVTLIEETGSRTADGTLNVPVVELILHDGAKLSYITLQELDDSVKQIGMHRAVLHRDSTLTWVTATLGGQMVKLNVDTELRGPGTNAEVLGLYFASGNEFIDFHTLQDHIAPNAGSDLLFKGVLKDTSRVVFSGLIRVHEGAQKTDAYQKNNNLILSETARADSIPNLEIAANDVRCSHGATAGKVSADHLFYLMSRGLSRREAERLIVTGFLSPLIERVPLQDLRERLYALIDGKLTN
ncbi:MAG: FeS assembly protein SufD [Chloroflexi bacterium]|nr:FeS assembly protein SufD [Chloroflexota bacterium]